MIAARAGCTRGAIYWYFNEKKDLPATSHRAGTTIII
ncbi:TetR family transcriptional regulator [Escherichia coli]|nr:TetR family transcriptional regulator [Escherichia coli]WCE56158.1 TetR family transcriptional regulator [Escherichia coli]